MAKQDSSYTVGVSTGKLCSAGSNALAGTGLFDSNCRSNVVGVAALS